MSKARAIEPRRRLLDRPRRRSACALGRGTQCVECGAGVSKRRTTMKLPLSSRLMILAAVAVLLEPCPAVAQIKIGVFGPMTGDAAAYGQSMREGVEIAVKEQNAKGGVLGQQIAVVYGDDTGKPEQAVSGAKRARPGGGGDRNPADRHPPDRPAHHHPGQSLGLPFDPPRYGFCRESREFRGQER